MFECNDIRKILSLLIIYIYIILYYELINFLCEKSVLLNYFLIYNYV